MKLEGQERERPGDILWVTICMIGLLAFWISPFFWGAPKWAIPFWFAIASYQHFVIHPLMKEDADRMRRNTNRIKQEIRRLERIKNSLDS